MLLTIARGRTNAEIADELHISLSTVKTHIASLMGKLGRGTVSRWRCGHTRPDASATEPTVPGSRIPTVGQRAVTVSRRGDMT